VQVIPIFQKKGEVLGLSDSLSTVLRVIEKRYYSQFPVYDGNNFKGLLTENGITRWLAHHVSNELSLIEWTRLQLGQRYEKKKIPR